MQQENSPRLRLAEARTQRGLSQQAVADELGTTHVNVSRWERGVTKPSPYFRRKLCTLYQQSEQELDLLPTSPSSESSAPAASFAEQSSSPPPPIEPTPLYDPAIPLGAWTPLVGRDNDIARVRQRLLSGDNVALTALNGLPGVGKTALTIHLAHDEALRAHFSDGILWAGLGPHPNMSALLSRWGTLLGMSPSHVSTLNSIADWAKTLRGVIGERKMLLVIDDAWTVEDALTFKVGGPHCTHLVTTRYPSIASLITVDGAIMLHELSEDEGIALLRQLAPQIVNVEQQKALDLVQAVGGLPLALTLMGNYLRKQAYSGQARRINAALQRLSVARERLNISEPHVPVESHPSLSSETPISLQSVISVTDQLLDEQARETLYALSIFPPKPNSFSEEAALVVAACDAEALDLLNDSSLLESSGSGRYTLHQTIADYAQSHLDATAADNARARLLDYALDFVEQHQKDYAALDQESTTIQAAIEQTQSGEQHLPQLVSLIVTFAPFMLIRAWYAQAEAYLQIAYAAAQTSGDTSGVASTLLYRGQVAQKQGHLAQAEAYFQAGLTIARQLEASAYICDLLSGLGAITWRRGEYNQAETYLQEGLQLARQIDDQERMSDLLNTLASIETNRGNYRQAELYLREGLMLAQKSSNQALALPLFVNLGTTVGEQGNYQQAESYFHDGLLLARQLGYQEGICILLANLGDVASELGKYEQAEAYFQEGLTLARQIGHREWTCGLLINLGTMLSRQKMYIQAETCLHEGLELARQIARPQMIANTLYEYGNLHLEQQRTEQARTYFDEMLATTPEEARDFIALAQYGLSRTAALSGDSATAQRQAEESLATLQAIGHRDKQEVQQWLQTLTSTTGTDAARQERTQL
jgi:tetratricopeptide (TPR) repeat protein/transcriptional regulator with XRE-family HTH domain